jgi:dTDP-4-dehydrorhamnose reductase
MNILVFGKTGQLGVELQRRADVFAVARDRADLAHPGACKDLIAEMKPDAVINAAAFTGVDKAEDDPLALVINGDAPSAMAEAAASLNIPFVHISTDYAFSGTGTVPWRPLDATDPVNIYGKTKLAGEIGVRAAGGIHAILRTSWIFSAHGGNFVKTVLGLAKSGDRLRVVSDQVGGPTPAAALADACLTIAAALARHPEKSGTYHFSGAPDVSWADFARVVFSMADKNVFIEDIPASHYPTRSVRPANSRLDCSSMTAEFGLSRPDWRIGLSDVLRDLKAI